MREAALRAIRTRHVQISRQVDASAEMLQHIMRALAERGKLADDEPLRNLQAALGKANSAAPRRPEEAGVEEQLPPAPLVPLPDWEDPKPEV